MRTAFLKTLFAPLTVGFSNEAGAETLILVTGTQENNQKVFQDAFDHDKGNLQFWGAVSTGGSPLDFWLFLQFLCAI